MRGAASGGGGRPFREGGRLMAFDPTRIGAELGRCSSDDSPRPAGRPSHEGMGAAAGRQHCIPQTVIALKKRQPREDWMAARASRSRRASLRD